MRYGDTVVLDGGEIKLENRVDGGELDILSNLDGGEIGAITPVIQAGDYERLDNKPRINGVELEGNLTTEDLHIQAGVTSWNGQTGDVVYTPPTIPVQSVNGKTGTVILNASDVGALPVDTSIPTKTSDLTNDSGFTTKTYVDTVISSLPVGAVYVNVIRSYDPKTGETGYEGDVPFAEIQEALYAGRPIYVIYDETLYTYSGDDGGGAIYFSSVRTNGARVISGTFTVAGKGSGTVWSLDESSITAPVTSVNGMTGDVVLEIGAMYVEVVAEIDMKTGLETYTSVETYDEITAAIRAGRAVFVTNNGRVFTYNGDDGDDQPFYFIAHLINENSAESMEFTLSKDRKGRTLWELWDGVYEPPAYTAGNGLTLSNNEFSIDASVLSDIETAKNAFMLYDFSQDVSITLPAVTSETPNTSIPNVDIDIGAEMAVEWAIAGMVKYEVKNGSTRINAFPICSFSMSSQRILRLRMMCSGTTDKAMTAISGALLLKHR